MVSIPTTQQQFTNTIMTRAFIVMVFLCGIVLTLFVTTVTASVNGKSSTKQSSRPVVNSTDDRFIASSTHYDLPISTPPMEMSLELLQLYSRHGNRAADPIVDALCPKRQVLTDLYHQQQASYGALTYNGIRSLWDLGTFTHEQYVKSGFISGTYTRATSQIRAAASDRTLISANSFSAMVFKDKYANSPYPIPAAVLTSVPEEDNLLEVRKARCEQRLEFDLKYFDQNIATNFINNHKDLIEMISNACGFDIMHGPELTNGEFSVMQLVKDLSDALTGDMLEGFPLMDGVPIEKRAEFLQFAEDIFKRRHYRTDEMDSYLAGNVPNRIIKLIDRRISFNTNTTVFEHFDLSRENNQNHQNQEQQQSQSQSQQDHISHKQNNNPNNNNIDITYRDVIVQDSKRLPIIRPRPPRRFFAYHAHREVLYGLKNFLKLDLGVERPGLPTGLIHPGTGIFFELWQNHTETTRLIKQSENLNLLPVLNPNRNNRQRYLQNQVDNGFYLRILLWVPCFDGIDKDIYSSLDQKTKIELRRKDDLTGEELCLGRVRTLPQCDNKEFCPISRVKEIFAENYNTSNGDFRAHCRPNQPFIFDNRLQQSSTSSNNQDIEEEEEEEEEEYQYEKYHQIQKRKFKTFQSIPVQYSLSDFFNFNDARKNNASINEHDNDYIYTTTPTTSNQESNTPTINDETDSDSDSNDDDDDDDDDEHATRSRRRSHDKNNKSHHTSSTTRQNNDHKKNNHKNGLKTRGAGLFIGESSEDIYNTASKSKWAENLAKFTFSKKIESQKEQEDEAKGKKISKSTSNE